MTVQEKGAQNQSFGSGCLGESLPRDWVGAKKFGTSLEAHGEIKHFWRDIPAFCWDIPAVPKMFENEKKTLCSILAPTFSTSRRATTSTQTQHLMQHLYCACIVALLSASGKGTFDVESRVPRDEGRSCRCRPFEGSYI